MGISAGPTVLGLMTAPGAKEVMELADRATAEKVDAQLFAQEMAELDEFLGLSTRHADDEEWVADMDEDTPRTMVIPQRGRFDVHGKFIKTAGAGHWRN